MWKSKGVAFFSRSLFSLRSGGWAIGASPLFKDKTAAVRCAGSARSGRPTGVAAGSLCALILLALNHTIMQHLINASTCCVFANEMRIVVSSSRSCGDVRGAATCADAIASERGRRAVRIVGRAASSGVRTH